MDQLSHMVDEGASRWAIPVKKPRPRGHAAASRHAVASARVLMSSETLSAVQQHRTTKGDPLEAARLAGIMAAKRTAELIPLCHPLPLRHIEVRAELTEARV